VGGGKLFFYDFFLWLEFLWPRSVAKMMHGNHMDGEGGLRTRCSALTKFDNVCLDVSLPILREIHEHAFWVIFPGQGQ